MKVKFIKLILIYCSGVQKEEIEKLTNSIKDQLKSYIDTNKHPSSSKLLSKEISQGSAGEIAGNQGPPGLWGKDGQQMHVSHQKPSDNSQGKPRKDVGIGVIKGAGLTGQTRSSKGTLHPTQHAERRQFKDILNALKKIADCQRYGTCLF